MIDFMLFGGFDLSQMNGQTDEWTFVLLESLLRLKKIYFIYLNFQVFFWDVICFSLF